MAIRKTVPTNFPTTRWTLVSRAAAGLGEQQRAALNELLSQYWPVLRARLVVHRRFSQHDADDLVQGFVTSEVIGRELLQVADEDRGRLRSLLCKSLDNYISKQIRKGRAAKRGPERTTSIECAEYASGGAVNQLTAEEAHEAAWARNTLAMVLANMELHCTETNRIQLWRLFEARVVRPILDGADAIAYDQLVKELRFPDAATAQNTLVTAKRMFCRTMRSTLAAQGVAEKDLDEEIQDLRKCLSVCD